MTRWRTAAPPAGPDSEAASETGAGSGTGSPRPAATAAQRAALEAERDFLLASLRDLATENAAGEIDDAQCEALTARYTARAARVLRTLDAIPSTEAGPEARPRTSRRRRRAVVLVPLVGVLAIGAVLLPSALSQRGGGQTITGNAQSARDVRADIERAVTEAPVDPSTHRAYARLMLDDGDLLSALQHYDEAARLDPRDAESRAYAGWIVSLAGLTDQALSRLDAAIDADPAYPDAYVFRGMVRRAEGDAAGAVADLRRYLELAPDSPMRLRVEQLISELDAASPPG